MTCDENTKITLSGFEGPEKLLEIWFVPSKQSGNTLDGSNSESTKKGLRLVPLDIWKDMLDIVNCRVLSTIENDHINSYLLSESSMFVFDYRLTLKTCGTTRLLLAVEKILEIAANYCKLTEIEAIFYSRKSFLFPELQLFPHGNWNAEVSYLDKIFPNDRFDTSGYVLGKVNGDHWNFYMATPVIDHHTGSNGLIRVVDDVHYDIEQDDDVTLEILMTDLHPDSMKKFWRTSSEVEQSKLPHNIHLEKHIFEDNRRLLRESKLESIYPKAIVDDYVFDPCGYSANALLGQYYYTIHVTPESNCSYASFETTIPVKLFRHISGPVADEYESFSKLIQKVIGVFNPGKFSTTLFVRHSMKDVLQDTLASDNIPGFHHRDRVVQSLGKWELLFSHYERR